MCHYQSSKMKKFWTKSVKLDHFLYHLYTTLSNEIQYIYCRYATDAEGDTAIIIDYNRLWPCVVNKRRGEGGNQCISVPVLSSLNATSFSAGAHSLDQCFAWEWLEQQGPAGHLENISLERRGPFVGWRGVEKEGESTWARKLFGPVHFLYEWQL